LGRTWPSELFGDGTAYAGIGEYDQFRGLHEVAAIDDRGEDTHSEQYPSIERHSLTLTRSQ
jgi:hypothetical protein